MAPERVAPGRPLSGVSPMDVSYDKPFFTAQTDAPDPRWRIMRFNSVGG